VSFLETDVELRLLSGVLLVVGGQTPWWQVLVLLVPYTAVVVVEGRGREPCCWGPLVLFGVLMTNLVASPTLRLTRGRSLTGDYGKAAETPEDEENVTRTRSSLIFAIKGLPDWAPPTKSELQGWRGAFALHDETLVGVYACSVVEKVTHHGRLYISFGKEFAQGHLCFRGLTILRSALEFVILVENVQEVKITDGVVTVHLKSPIMMKGQRDLYNSVEIKTGERGTAALNSLFTRGSKGGADDEDETQADSDSEPGELSLSLRSASCIPAEQQPFNILMEVNIPGLPAHAVKEELLEEEWTDSNLYIELLGKLGATETNVASRVDDSDSTSTVHIREVTFVMPVPPAPMCPRKTKVTTSCRVSIQAGEPTVITMDTSSVSHDVPFGSNFVVQERMVMTWAEDGRSCSITKSARLVFLKSVGWLKGTIQSSVMTEQAKGSDILLSVLRKRAVDNRLERAFTTQKGWVWELQRRSNLFKKDWRAPFLPHDGEKRWRWVDATYSRHRWIPAELDQEDGAARAFPPLDVGVGWEVQGRWQVDMKSIAAGTADKDGWQHALDFYRVDSFWTKMNTGMHCRRRLWTCDFQEASTA